MVTLQIMWKRNSVSSSEITFYHSCKSEDQFQYFGLNQDSNIVHLRRLIEVKLFIKILSCARYVKTCFLFLGVEDTRVAFRRHFERELPIYGNLCIVSLVEQSGKEKIIGDAFTEQMIHLNEARITYVTFDFHEHW